jgi:hypothetical protein
MKSLFLMGKWIAGVGETNNGGMSEIVFFGKRTMTECLKLFFWANEQFWTMLKNGEAQNEHRGNV